MLFGKRNWFALVVLVIAVAIGGAGCRGFFVSPTLTSITVSTLGSTTLSTPGSTVQLIATGNYDDGSHKNLTGAATWSKSNDPQNLVTVSTTEPGLVTANTIPTTSAQVTVQAAAKSSDGSVVSGTITLTVGQSSSTTLTITSTPASPISISTTTSVTFTATLNGSDVTSATTFTSSDPTVISITGNTGTILKTGTVTITGTDSSANANGTLSVTVQ